MFELSYKANISHVVETPTILSSFPAFTCVYCNSPAPSNVAFVLLDEISNQWLFAFTGRPWACKCGKGFVRRDVVNRKIVNTANITILSFFEMKREKQTKQVKQLKASN